MAENVRQSSQSAQSDPRSTPSQAPASSSTPAIGTIVLVRSSLNSLAPAIITNDFSGQNAPGVVSLIVFNANTYDNTLVKAVPQAQAESYETKASDLANEMFMYWMPVGSSLAKRDLQKEMDEQRERDRKEAQREAEQKEESPVDRRRREIIEARSKED